MPYLSQYYRCFYFFISLTIVAIFSYSCKKEGELPDQKEEEHEPALVPDIRYAKLESVDLLSYFLAYRLNLVTRESGIIYSQDSVSLAENKGTEILGTNLAGVYDINIKLASNPSKRQLWYKIFYKDETGKRVYSTLYRHQIPDYLVQNKYIVHGPALYNIHPTEHVITWGEGYYKGVDNSLGIMTYSLDTDAGNYKASLNGIDIPLKDIKSSSKYVNRKVLVFDIPEQMSFGTAALKLFCRNQLVYTDSLTVVSGGLISKTEHPEKGQGNEDIFVQDDMLYTFDCSYWSGAKARFYKWNSETDTWTKLPSPSENFSSGGRIAQAIKNVIYFPPYSEDKRSQAPFLFFEYLWTFNTITNQWTKVTLQSTNDYQKVRAGLSTLACFVYENKFYCISSWTRAYSQVYTLDVYNPADNSFSTVMDLPGGTDIESYRAVVCGNKPYVLVSRVYTPYMSSTINKNEFYEVDLAAKKTIRRNWVIDPEIDWKWNEYEQRIVSPVLASYKGKIYAYGGRSVANSNTLHAMLFAVYNPERDLWEPASGYSYHTARVSQTRGLLVSLNEKLYVGLGLNREVIGAVDYSEINRSIFRISVK